MANNALVGVLRVLLTANSAEFESGMDKAAKKTRQFGTDVDKAGALTKNAGKILSDFAGALGIGLSAGAFIALGKQILDAADATVKLSDKTGIAIEPLQRLQFVAEQSGNSIDQVASAISMLQRRLAGGDESATGAIDKLGLSLQAIENMSPDQQFLAIAREVAKIEDPMQRAKVATDLFGRAGAELLPTLIADVEKLAKEAPVMSEKATKAFDAIGDAISKAATIGKNFAGETIGTIIDAGDRLGRSLGALATGELQDFIRIMTDAETELPKVASALDQIVPSAKGVGMSFEEIERTSRELTETGKQQAKETENLKRVQDALFGRDVIAKANEFASALGDVSNVSKLSEEKKKELKIAVDAAIAAYDRLGERAPKALRDIQAATTPLIESTTRLAQAWAPLAGTVSDSGDEIRNVMQGLNADGTLVTNTLQEAAERTDEADKEMREWARTTGATLAPAVRQARTDIDEANESTRGWAASIGDAIGNLPHLIQQGLTGGGGIGGALKAFTSQIGAGLFGENGPLGFFAGGALSGLGGAMTKGFSKLFGDTIGNALGTALPGLGQAIGALLGPLAGKIGGFFKGLFGGVSEEVKQARTEIDGFQAKLADTLTATQRAEAGGEKWKMTVIAVRDAYLATGRTAAEAEAIVRQLWDTDHPDAARAAMARINEVLEEQGRIAADNKKLQEETTAAIKDAQTELDSLAKEGEIDWQKMREAAERYGVDLASLGPKFQSGRLHESAQQIWNDFILLTRGGADVGGVLLGMKDEIVDLARQATQFGIQIPANFKPLIDNLLASTELTDDEREALQKLGAENFGDPIVSRLDTIATRMGELVGLIADLTDRLIRNVPQAAQTAAAGLAAAFGGLSFTVPVNFNVGEVTAPGGFDIPHMAAGGIVTSPTLAMIGERGPEAVIPLERVNQSGVMGSDPKVLDAIERLNANLSRFMRSQPQALSVAMQDALLLGGRA